MGDESRRRRGFSWTFRGDESRRRRARDADVPWETSRGDTAAATWTFRGDEHHRYYDAARRILYVVDCAAPDRLAEAWVELLHLLNNPIVDASRVTVVLNKADLPGADADAARSLLGLDALPVDVVEGSLFGLDVQVGQLVASLRDVVLEAPRDGGAPG